MFKELKLTLMYKVLKMKEYNLLMMKRINMLHSGKVMENIIHQWTQTLYSIYTLSSGTLIHSEIGSGNEIMFKETLKTINLNIEQLISTLNYFNEFLNHDTEKMSLDLEFCIKNSIKLIQPLLKVNNIYIDINCITSIEIEGIEIEFIQIILNIINETIYILNEKEIGEKHILINIENFETSIEIIIRNNAEGIKYDDLRQKYNDLESRGFNISKQMIELYFCGEIEVFTEEYYFNNQKICSTSFKVILNK